MSRNVFSLILTIFCSTCLFGCASEGPSSSSNSSSDSDSDSSLTSDSFYLLDTEWIDQNQQKIKLKDFQDRPLIISMVYLSCTYICPTVISEIEKVEAAIAKEDRDGYRVLVVSFDPKKDTPLAMKDYGDKRGIDFNRWSFATHLDDGKIRELAALLDFKYQSDEAGNFTHSFAIALLDKNGVLQVKIVAPAQSNTNFTKRLRELLKQR